MLLRPVLVLLVSSSILIRELDVVAVLTTTNIDTEEPSVIRSPASASDSNDGFGWAAVFHRIRAVSENDPVEVSLNNTRIVIGAPRGTFPGGLPLTNIGDPPANRTGLVYSCTLQGADACVGVRGNTSLYLGGSVPIGITNHIQDFSGNEVDFFIPALSEGRLFDEAPASRLVSLLSMNELLFDRKDGQLMGSFLASRGNRFMACGSRWATRASQALPQSQPRGICFVGDMELQNFRTLYSCRGSGDSSTSLNGNGYCSSGFSGVLLEDQVNVGAPGAFGFSGHVYSRLYGQRNTDNFFSAMLENVQGQTPAQYFGFQVAAGHVTTNIQSMPETDIAVSAPRYDGIDAYLGRVFIYPAGTPRTVTPTDFSSDVIQGTQTSEFFGYSITLVDLTGDGYDELVVGAPMYTQVSPLMPELGRIYIFFNTEGNLTVMSPLVLNGSDSYGRFGFTVANAGDLSGDGHEDLVVSAPYERSRSSTQNTGAVYVYYGADSREMFASQQPQIIHADSIVNSLVDKVPLKTFGFSLAGGVDVDSNRHNDILAGSPDSQTVVVLRSLPFVNVTVELSTVTTVNVDVNPSFELLINATYQSRDPGIQGAFNVTFTIQEIIEDENEPRIFFSSDQTGAVYNGMFTFTSANTIFPVTVVVFTKQIVSQLDDYRLRLDLVDISRSRPEVDGRQEVASLSAYPRLRLLGNSTIDVDVIDPCFPAGCISDVIFQSISPSSAVLIAGDMSAVEFNITYINNASDEARTVDLVISNIPTQFFTSVSIASTACVPPAFEENMGVASANCTITSRLTGSTSGTRVLTFGVNSDFIGNEDTFSINMEITVDETQKNRDRDTSNNARTLEFMVDSRSSISLSLFEFSSTSVSYDLMPIPNIQNSGSLGQIVSLSAVVSNSGPSIIQNATLTISLPSRVMDITGDYYFLYPTELDHQAFGNTGVGAGTNVTCTTMGLDPNQLNTPSVNGGRKRRSLGTVNIAVRNANREAKKRAAEAGIRKKRQAPSDFTLDCSSPNNPCTTFTCDIRRLTTEGVRIVLDSHLDGRFFAAGASNRTFTLTATATVSVAPGFQQDDDQNAEDNTQEASITLEPDLVMEERDGLLIHAIIWPIVGGVIIFIGLVVLLYCVGFFRRKKKPGDDEIEGDFDAPPTVPPEIEKSKLTQAQEGTTM